jgi:pimeloyl-ACP methyl ester carboxylesterase
MASSATISFGNSSGSLVWETNQNIPAGQTITIDLLNISQIPSGFDGSAVVSSDQPLYVLTSWHNPSEIGLSRDLWTDNTAIEYGANVVQLPYVVHKVIEDTSTQFSVQNVGSSNASITITYYDQNGSVSATVNDAITVGGVSRYATGDVSELGEDWEGSVTIQSDPGTQIVSEVILIVKDGTPETHANTGRITDNSGAPLNGVFVSYTGQDGVYSNSNGEYSITGLSAGMYTITPSKLGYFFTPSSHTVTVPPDASEKNFTGMSISDNKPIVVLVHGWQGLSQTGGYACSGATPYNGTNSTLGDLPDMLSEDYSVWIAHLDSSPSGTPSLIKNADCLKSQIETIYQNTGKKMILVAHSMGGLVSRACIDLPGCRDKVSALYTLGSPHAGINSVLVIKLLLKMAERLVSVPITTGLCIWQAAVCDMSSENMVLFNGFNPNKRGINYVFVGGDPEHN